jgi:hypothetical protein
MLPKKTRPNNEPPLPAYHLDEILELRDRLWWGVETFVSQELAATAFQRFYDYLCSVLPPRVLGEAVHDSIRHLAGMVLHEKPARELCHRLAGNVDGLAAGIPVLPWKLQRAIEWVPFQITACRRGLSRRGKRGAYLTYVALAGTPCGMKIVRFLSKNQCLFLAPFFGFRRFTAAGRQLPYSYETPEQLVSMRCYGLVEPDQEWAGVHFRKHEFPASVHDYNREVIKLRFRLERGYTCPRGYPSSFPCHRCQAGYRECPAATHAQEWEKKLCPACGEERWFDTEVSPKSCLTCYYASL